MSEKKLTLLVEWFDPLASVIRKFHFHYYLQTKMIEIYDIVFRKMFLKKINYPQINIEQFYIGNTITCFNRELKILDFVDQFTRKIILKDTDSSKTLGLIKPDLYSSIGAVLSMIEREFKITNIKLFQMKKQDAYAFYAKHQNQPYFDDLINYMISDYVVGIQLTGTNAVNRLKQLAGNPDPEIAKKQNPNSIRAIFGKNILVNGFHASSSPKDAEIEISQIFSKNIKSTPKLSNCSLGLIKPHILKNKKAGEIVHYILEEGFQISAMQMIWLDINQARQFYDAYKFLPECPRMVEHLTTGPSLALQIRQQQVIPKFRAFCGPYDPNIAKKIYKDTLRARYGLDRVYNALHCTDLEEDGELQVQFVFNVLIS